MKMRALILDDSRIMRNMVMTTLQNIGLAEFVFTEAEDGAVGLTKFDPKNFDILFVDWNMPNISGIEFVRKVRINKNAVHIPIVMVTSEQTMGKVQEALDAGANAYITKPFTVEYLQKKLRPVLESITEKPVKSGGFFGKLMGG